MALRSKIFELPDEVRGWLDKELVSRGFTGYRELEALLAAQGYFVGKSSIHRYAVHYQDQICKNERLTALADQLLNACPDELENKSLAVMNLVWSGYLDALMMLSDIKETGDIGAQIKLLGEASRSIAPLARASLLIRDYQKGVRQAKKQKLTVKEETLDISTLTKIQESLYGVFDHDKRANLKSLSMIKAQKKEDSQAADQRQALTINQSSKAMTDEPMDSLGSDQDHADDH